MRRAYAISVRVHAREKWTQALTPLSKVLRVMQIQSGPQCFVLYNEVSAIENVR